jgi:hypothetical protein
MIRRRRRVVVVRIDEMTGESIEDAAWVDARSRSFICGKISRLGIRETRRCRCLLSVRSSRTETPFIQLGQQACKVNISIHSVTHVL